MLKHHETRSYNTYSHFRAKIFAYNLSAEPNSRRSLVALGGIREEVHGRMHNLLPGGRGASFKEWNIMRHKMALLLASTAGLIALSAAGAQASTVAAFSFTSASFATFDPFTAELGYDFTTDANPTVVTALGYINDGFNGTHTISIFQVSNQAAVAGASATVTTVGGGSTSTTFTYADLAKPVVLAANTEYQIVSQFFPNEHYFINAQGLVSADGLTIDDAVWDDYGSVPATPAFAQNFAAVNDPGDFGPNFQVATPLPAALPLFATGLTGLGLLGWRRKRKKTAA